MENKMETIVVDVDGTLYTDFKKDDKEIINKIFSNSSIIRIVDSFAWKINGLDFISNSMEILKLRIILYSILTFSNYKKNLLQYESMYKEKLEKCVLKLFISPEFTELEKKYKVIIVTNNEFSVDVVQRYFLYSYFASNSHQRKKYISRIAKIQKIVYVVGNNFSDDIVLARKIKSKAIYVGHSRIRQLFKPTYYVRDFDEALSLLLE